MKEETSTTKIDGRTLQAMQRRMRTRELLLRTARNSLLEGRTLNIADIANDAEVAVATVYNHFSSLEEILRAITEDLVNRSIKDTLSIVKASGSRAASEMLPTLLYESLSALKDLATTKTIPGVFLADPEIIEKLYEAVLLILSESEGGSDDETREKSRTITYVLLGALIRTKDYVTPDGAGYRPDDDAEATIELLRTILKAISEHS